MSTHFKTLGLGLALAVGLSACGEDEFILPGPREALRPAEETPLDAVSGSRAFQSGAPVRNAAWTHVNGSPSHLIAHPALVSQLELAWQVDIGAGNDRRHRLTADPVVAGGRIYTLDSRARVSAVSTAGATVWTRDLTPVGDSSDDASGGGLAFADGRLYVTSGFGMLSVLDGRTGATLWTQDLDAAATAAPTVADGIVFLVTRNAVGWAIDAITGRILWQVLGAPSDSGLVGGAPPVIAGNLVVFPFSSGQLIAAERGTGRRAWAGSVAGSRSNRAFSQISDITGGPIADGRLVFAGNHSGRAAAFDAITGERRWLADEGSLTTMWRAGDSLFLVTDENDLVRLDAATGETIWSTSLPFFERDDDKRKATFLHYGPVLAGGRLIVASDSGVLRLFDPVNGQEFQTLEMPDGAGRNPVIANGNLYLVGATGQLLAFR